MDWGKYFLPACGFVMRIIPDTWADAVYMEVRMRIPQREGNVNGMTLSWAAIDLVYDIGMKT